MAPNIPMSKTIRYKEKKHICISWIPEMKDKYVIPMETITIGSIYIYITWYICIITYTKKRELHFSSKQPVPIFAPSFPAEESNMGTNLLATANSQREKK